MYYFNIILVLPTKKYLSPFFVANVSITLSYTIYKCKLLHINCR